MLTIPLGCGSPTDPAGNPLTLTTTSLQDGIRSVLYADTVRATGGEDPYTWTVPSGSLPDGLSLHSSTGVISGTPTSAGTESFTIQVAGGDGQSASASLSIAVAGAATLLPGDSCGTHPPSVIASFADANLAAAVRAALGIGPSEELSCGVVAGITTLDASSSEIVSVLGIQNLTSLTTLDLSDNSITDLQPLLDNPGLGAGDTVDLSVMVVSCAEVTALRAKSITVISNCP